MEFAEDNIYDNERDRVSQLLINSILDIHGVAELLGIKRSSVNTLISKPEFNFPEPIYETSGEQRHPVRLWYRKDVEEWQLTRRRREDPPSPSTHIANSSDFESSNSDQYKIESFSDLMNKAKDLGI
jgi:predicted DNA-binding transcriptional regulator AlpA